MPSFFRSTIDSRAALQRERAVRFAIDLGIRNIRIGHHLGRIEHSQTEARGEQASQVRGRYLFR